MVQFELSVNDVRLLSQEQNNTRSYQLHIGENKLPSFVVEIPLDEKGNPAGDGRITSRMDVLRILSSKDISPVDIERIAAAAMYAAQIARKKKP